MARRQEGLVTIFFIFFLLGMQALDDVGQKIDKARESYQVARNRLTEGRGNLVRRSIELRQLGVKAQKELPEGLVAQALEDES